MGPILHTYNERLSNQNFLLDPVNQDKLNLIGFVNSFPGTPAWRFPLAQHLGLWIGMTDAIIKNPFCFHTSACEGHRKPKS